MSAITTHILDLSTGRPAARISVKLDRQADDGSWQSLASGKTDDDGRLRDLVSSEVALTAAIYRLVFATEPYFKERGISSLYPEVIVTFRIDDLSRHYHIPLLLSPFGYSTYRGS